MGAALYCLYNGRETSSQLTENRGLAYGDGVFETLLVVKGRALWREAHLERMADAASTLGLCFDTAELRAELDAVCAKSTGRSVLKIQLFRASGGRGYLGLNSACERLISLWPAPQSNCWQSGAKVILCDTRLSENPQFAGLKHLNRLEQVLAAREIHQAGADEGLMLDASGALIEGGRSNLFAVRDGVLLTPPLNRSGIHGIMRQKIIAMARDSSLPLRVCALYPSHIASAEEMFLCNSVFGIWPIVSVGCVRKKIGPISRHLQARFESSFHD